MASAAVLARAAYREWRSPPGGFWREDGEHHRAGDPVMRDTHWAHYVAFYHLNATVLVSSLLIVVLLMSERSYRGDAKVVALMLAAFIDLASFFGSFVAGTTAYGWTWVHTVVSTFVALAGAIYVLREITRCLLAKLKRSP